MPPRPALDVAAELRLVPGLGSLGSELIEELARGASVRTVHANIPLVEQGAVATSVVILVRGAAKAVRQSAIEGADVVVIDVMRAPHVIADVSTLDGRPSTASVITLRSSQIVALDRAVVAEAVQRSPALAQFFLRCAADELRAHVRRIDELVAGSVDARVKHLLEGLAKTHGTALGQGRFIALPLRRKDIARMVNATTETVSRLLAKFEREGLVRSTRDGIWWRTVTAPP
jgi:CRP-like cAMP-binding protein